MGVDYVRNLWINTELLPDQPHGLWEWIMSGTCGLTQSCFLTNHTGYGSGLCQEPVDYLYRYVGVAGYVVISQTHIEQCSDFPHCTSRPIIVWGGDSLSHFAT
ncbi:hypothetical protein RRG08_020119 [Elysia crispata]|uniref:Uncharacterized protein n=1 Tax=Elysia crispata TaxID=231223 RepID=A0AAE1A4Z9_9GAST|nr:hypothetical protein RRG08_020119 [Elysia crispata]